MVSDIPLRLLIVAVGVLVLPAVVVAVMRRGA